MRVCCRHLIFIICTNEKQINSEILCFFAVDKASATATESIYNRTNVVHTVRYARMHTIYHLAYFQENNHFLSENKKDFFEFRNTS